MEGAVTIHPWSSPPPASQPHDRNPISISAINIIIIPLLIQLFLLIPITHAQTEAFGCGDYSGSCGLCASAPPELLCGWCADSSTCHYGGIQGPAQGECKGVSWGFGVSSCQSPQALCDKHSSCDQCVRNTTTCNWCDTLSRCLYTDTSGTSTTSGGVSCSQWDWNCPSNASQAVTCSALSECDTCTSVSGCSWCGYALSGSCIDNNDACLSSLPLTATPTACPIPSSDTQGSSPCNGFDGAGCSKCNQFSKCGWCFLSSTCDSGSELGADYGYCGNSPTNFASSDNQCTTKSGTSGASFTTASFILAFDSSSQSGTIEIVGMLLLSLFGLFSLTFIVILACVRAIAPRQGALSHGTTSTGLQPNAADKSLRVGPSCLTGFSMAIKICSLAVDEWNVSQSNGVHISYGLFAAKSTYQGQIHTTSYSAICSGTSRNDLCGLLQTGGALTLVWHVFALLTGSTLAFYLVQALRDFTQLKRTAIKIWRLAAIQFSCTGTSLLFWLVGCHIVLHHIDPHSNVGISFILGLIGLVMDLALIVGTRYTVRRTPRRNRGTPHSSRSPATIARPGWLKPIIRDSSGNGAGGKPFGGSSGGNSSVALSGSGGTGSTLESVPEEGGGMMTNHPSGISRGGSQFLAQSGTGPGDGRGLRGLGRGRPSNRERDLTSNLNPQFSVDPDIETDGGADGWKKWILDDDLTPPGVVPDDRSELPMASPQSNNHTLLPPTSSAAMSIASSTASSNGVSVGSNGASSGGVSSGDADHLRSSSHAIDVKADTPEDDDGGRRRSESTSRTDFPTAYCVRCGANVIIGPHSVCSHCGVVQPYTPYMVEHSVAKRTTTR